MANKVKREEEQVYQMRLNEFHGETMETKHSIILVCLTLYKSVSRPVWRRAKRPRLWDGARSAASPAEARTGTARCNGHALPVWRAHRALKAY